MREGGNGGGCGGYVVLVAAVGAILRMRTDTEATPSPVKKTDTERTRFMLVNVCECIWHMADVCWLHKRG